MENINKECTVTIDREMNEPFQITNEILEEAVLSCPSESMYGWSPHEYSLNRKLWWTAVIEESIKLSDDQVLVITYVSLFNNIDWHDDLTGVFIR